MTGSSSRELKLEPQNLQGTFMEMWDLSKDYALTKMRAFIQDNAWNLETVRPAFQILAGSILRGADFAANDDRLINETIQELGEVENNLFRLAFDTLMEIGTPIAYLCASRLVISLYVQKSSCPPDELSELNQRALRVISVLKNIKDTQEENIAFHNITQIAQVAKHTDVTKSCISVFVERGLYSHLSVVIQTNPIIVPYVLESIGQRPLPNAGAAKEIKRPVLSYGTDEDKKQLFAWLVQVADSDDQHRDTAIEELFQGFETSAVIEALSQMENNPRANDKLVMLSSAPGFILPATSALQAKFARAVEAGRNDTIRLEAQVRGALKDVMGELETHLQKSEDATALRAIFDTAIAQGMMEESDKEIIDGVNANIAQQWVVDAERDRLRSLAQESQQRIGKLSL